MIEVITPGPLTLLEDQGRVGYAALGVTRSGAADQTSFRLGNRLVGNLEGEAAFEVTLGGFRALCHTRMTVAFTGAVCEVTVDGRPVGMNAPVQVHVGSKVVMHQPERGLRSYVAVRGGLDVAPVLGSRSTDVLAGLGPALVAPGDTFTLRRVAPHFPYVDVAPVPVPGGSTTLELLPLEGAGYWFALDDLAATGETTFVVTPNSNRVALRLQGRPLRRTRDAELPPQGLVPGAIQIPPDGQPVVFLRDHPVTGGYPVIGALTGAALDAAAQARPGDRLRLRWLRRPTRSSPRRSAPAVA